MTPTALVNALEHNSRQAERRLREAEQALCVESEQETRLEHLISSKLTEIASLQLTLDPSHSQQAHALLEQRERARAALEQELQTVEQLIAERLDRRQQLHLALQGQAAQARDRLEQDPSYRQLLEQLEATQQAEQQAHAGYEEIREECATKLQGYRSNRLYRFLKDRHYGTEQYRGILLSRAMDRYLAMVVNFERNHANEQVLLAMQARNESQRQALGEALAQLQAQHQQCLDNIGSTAELKALKDEQANLDTLLAQSKAHASSLNAQLSAFAQQRDPHLHQIRQGIADRLKARPLAELIVEAAKTPSPHDDLLVSDLQLLHARLRELQQRMKGVQLEASDKRRLYDRAKTLEYALRDDHYKDPSHGYELRQPIEQILDDYMNGLLDQQGVQRLLDEGRQFVPLHRRDDPRNHSWGTSSSHTPGGFSSTGSIGGGGFSTSSSSGGGGFTTSSSF
ncbi:hypothetical protein ACNFIC_06040 [Pseudomonas sp. NY15463]|uniref:hypothetical protein n=1 Tax=Pseudomonas sp. NY15463 TaxID=3400361 RepID=UPI003A88114B